MEDVAERVRSTLEETVGREEMVGVSYYDEGEIGHVFRSEWAEEKYEPEQVDEIVRDLQLESLSHGFHEEVQEESLNATVRIYDEMLDIAVPTNETEGILVGLDVRVLLLGLVVRSKSHVRRTPRRTDKPFARCHAWRTPSSPGCLHGQNHRRL